VALNTITLIINRQSITQIIVYFGRKCEYNWFDDFRLLYLSQDV
jgi:hypothetical protein